MVPPQRVEYYDGLDQYITRGDLAAMYQVNPVLGSFKCFETDGAINATSYFPDLSQFTAVPGTFPVHGIPALKFVLNVTDSSRVNAYEFYFSTKDNAPLQCDADSPVLALALRHFRWC